MRFRDPCRLTCLLALIALASCAGGDTSVGPTTPPPSPDPLPPGVLTVSVEGLPDGAAADFIVAGQGVSRSGTASVSWIDLRGGAYTVTIRPVRTIHGTYAATPSSFQVSVTGGAPPTMAAVRYAPLPTVFVLSIQGVPTNVDAPVRVIEPDGDTVPSPASSVRAHAGRGTWSVRADTLATGGFRYAPSLASFDTTLLHGDTARVSVAYQVSSGAIAIVVAGLPSELDGQLRLAGPGGYARSIAHTETVTDLTPGEYVLTSATVAGGAIMYVPDTATMRLVVEASLIATPATVRYNAQVGSLSVSSTGLPTGSAAAYTLFGANDTISFAGDATIDSLPAGSYTLRASPVTAAGVKYSAQNATRTITVTTGATTSQHFAYAVVPTVVDIVVAGLPNGAAASLVLTPPSGDSSIITGSTRIAPTVSGRWRVRANNVTHGGARYVPTPTLHDSTISAGDTLRLPVQYKISTGSIAVGISGLPSGVNAAVTVAGPDGYAQPVPATSTLTMLAPGTYYVYASSVTASGFTYQPSSALQQLVVNASSEAASAHVSYATSVGSISIAATGLPGSVTPTFTVTGPNGSQPVNGTGTVTNLSVGDYTVAATTLSSAGITYTPSPASHNAVVADGGNSSVSFSYASSGGLNFFITSVHLTQATQRLDGAIPLVAGRDALLRVFVQATGANTARPHVRVRLYDGTTLLQTKTIAAPEMSVRQTLATGTLASTWNLLVPGTLMRPSLRVVAELDPSGAFPDADASDNVWPLGGTPQSIATYNVPTFNVRFVPVVVGALAGNVNVGNADNFLDLTRRLLPIHDVNADVRAPFTSSATALQSNDGNGNWLTVLSEINALRASDGAPSDMYYYGVVATTYSSGIAGYGYLPGRASIGWDKMPSADEVAAHEWGHNFGRSHSPCGVSGDASYPYAGGVIGQVGWNSGSGSLVQSTATDVMSYCSNQWISDYTWSAIMYYRGTSTSVADAMQRGVNGISRGGATGGSRTSSQGSATRGAATAQEGLLVWGRVVGGRIELEPAFRVRAPATPVVAGTHRLELLDDAGRALVDIPLRTDRVDHATERDERHFAVVLPWTSALESSLASVRVRDIRSPLRTAARSSAVRAAMRAAQGSIVDPRATITSVGRRAAVSWSGDAYRMAMVRDAATGQLMGFVRRPGDSVTTDGRRVEVVLSDGVRSMLRTP